MSRGTSMCQIDDCPKNRQKKSIFCKKHERKIPQDMLFKIKRFFKAHPNGYSVTEFDDLTKKANFSLTIDDYEKRFRHWKKKHSQKLSKKRIIVIPGTIRSVECAELWDVYDKVIKSMGFKRGQYYLTAGIEPDLLGQVFEDMVPCAVILLGEAGVKAIMNPHRREHGIIHGGNQVATPEKCFESEWKERPSSPMGLYNHLYQAPTISCECHPEEYEAFGAGEIREITKCLEWAKGFLYTGEVK